MITRRGQLGELVAVGTAAEIGIAGTAAAEVSSLGRGRRPATNGSPESREYISTTGGPFHRAVPSLVARGVPSWIKSATESNSKRSSICAADCRVQHLIPRLRQGLRSLLRNWNIACGRPNIRLARAEQPDLKIAPVRLSLQMVNETPGERCARSGASDPVPLVRCLCT